MPLLVWAQTGQRVNKFFKERNLEEYECTDIQCDCISSVTLRNQTNQPLFFP